jgi:NAD(P)H-dependent flavin oxidoreductase YrpB (nitropropane dioxygenase family)
MQEIREWFDGLVALSGSIAHGASILSAQAMGADFGYCGSALHRDEEANADQGYKQVSLKETPAYRLHQPLHRRAWQLPALFDRECRA